MTSTVPAPAALDIQRRVERYDWPAIAEQLDDHGWADLPGFLTSREADALAGSYEDDSLFRSRVVMARHGFGRGEYKYFSYPLPQLIEEVRASIYPRLVPIANRWNEAMNVDVRFPHSHQEFIRRCHAAGQTRPTPLLLRYEEGDFNALHQDVYGEHLFPLQMMILLSDPGREFTGGEFVVTEQRPRMQSRVEVVPLERGVAVIWAVRHRPVKGTRGTYRVTMRHGVARVRSGHRRTVGVIFHDGR